MRRLALWLLLTLLATGCRSEAPGPAGMWLYFLRRSGAAWTLMAAKVPSGEPQRLAEGVEGYAVAAGKLALLQGDVITVEEGAASRSLPCPDACHGLALSPQGEALAWLEGDYPVTSLHLRPLNGGEAIVLGRVRSRPVWSPDGEYLAAATADGLLLWSKATATTETLPLKAVSPPSWVDDRRLALVVAPGQAVLCEIGAPFPQPLLVGAANDALEIAWNPRGGQALLLRWEHRPPSGAEEVREERPGAATVGPQPFLYDAATGTMEALPGDAGASFTHPLWSPDGRYLVLVRMEVGVVDPQPQLWLYDVAQRQVVRRFERAALPAWGERP